uniref:Uncharacterized protein n=1 Tax=Ectopseudomonas mendocina (strain ymp) TaxID=399739 RepID=A4XTG2_ECTM1
MFDNPRRVSYRNCIGWNRPSDDTAGTDDGTIADRYTGQNNHGIANPYTMANDNLALTLAGYLHRRLNNMHLSPVLHVQILNMMIGTSDH